jgi:hypothetical protein
MNLQWNHRTRQVRDFHNKKSTYNISNFYPKPFIADHLMLRFHQQSRFHVLSSNIYHSLCWIPKDSSFHFASNLTILGCNISSIIRHNKSPCILPSDTSKELHIYNQKMHQFERRDYNDPHVMDRRLILYAQSRRNSCMINCSHVINII